MTTFLSDIVLAGANDIQFKNISGANTGKIESDGNDLVLSNAVGDILLGDGASDVYIGDGTNNVDILFEQSGSIKAEDGSSGVTLTLGSSDTTLALGGAISLADAVSAISGTGVNTIDIGTSVKPFKNIYAAHHVGGSSINYATSRGWVEDDAPLSSTQVGEFGGDFTRNGEAAENAVVWGDDPFNNKALLWKCILNTSDDNSDGGWNKNIVIPANNNIGYLSYVYFKTDFTPDNSNDGQVYLGGGQTTGQTLNLDGSNNTNPYSTSSALNATNNGGALTANRWYIMVGIYQAYNNSTTDNDTIAGVYDVETGEKVANGGEFKMGNNTTGQVHRAYMYYDTSTDANENVYFWNPGFHAIDGSEPKIQDLVKRQVYLDDNVKAAFGTGNDLEIYHDGSNSYINDSGSGSLYTLTDAYRLTNAAGTENMIWAAENSFVKLYYDNSAKLETVTGGVEITGELQADTLDIDGNADIAGNLVVDGGNITIDSDAAGASLTWKESDSTTVAGQLRSYANRGDIYLYADGTKTTELSAQSDSFIPALHIGGSAAASGGVLQTTGNVNIDGNADISGNLTGVDTLTATTLSVTNYGLASGDIPNNAADTTGNAATVTNGVYTTGDQTIAGVKTFTSNIKGTPADAGSNSLTLGRTDNSNYWYVNHAGNDFRLYNTASSGSHILFGVDSSGTVKANNVGIGTATPGEKLDVVGNIAVSGTVDGIDIAARDAILTSTTNTAEAALQKAGGTMSGAIAMGSQNITGGGTITGTTLTGTSLDINGNADISGDLTGLNNVTSTNFIIGGHTIDDVDLAGEFVDSNNHLITSAAAKAKFALINANTTGSSGSCTGNAATATTLATARTIAGVSFNGAANIALNNQYIGNGAGYTGDQSQSDINALAITTVGEINSGSWRATPVASVYLDADTAHLTTNQTFTGVKTFNEAINKKSLNFIFVANKFVNSTADETYFSLGDTDRDQPKGTEDGVGVVAVMPCNGILRQVEMVSSSNLSGRSWTYRLYRIPSGTAYTSEILVATVTASAGGAGNTNTTISLVTDPEDGTNDITYASGYSATTMFTKGDRALFSLQSNTDAAGSPKINTTFCFELDESTI